MRRTMLSLLLLVAAAIAGGGAVLYSPGDANLSVSAGCAYQGDPVRCVTERITAAEKISVAYAMRVLKSEIESGPEQFRAQCHPIAHQIGANTGAKSSDITAELTAVGKNAGMCDFGFVHGLLEGFADQRSADEMMDAAKPLCDAASANSEDHSLCMHGLGHSVWISYDGDTPIALKACERYTGVDARACVSGVVMQWATRGANTENTSFSSDTKLLQYSPVLCERLKGERRNGCLSQVWHALRIYPAEDERRSTVYALKYCSKVYEGSELLDCVDGVGRNLWADGKPSPEIASEQCNSLGSEEMYLSCLVGYASSRGVELLSAEASTEVCLIAPEAVQAECKRRALSVAAGQSMVSDPLRK